MESHGSEPSFVDSSIRVPQEEYQKIKNKARKVAKRTGQSKDELLKGYVEQWKIQNHHCAAVVDDGASDPLFLDSTNWCSFESYQCSLLNLLDGSPSLSAGQVFLWIEEQPVDKKNIEFICASTSSFIESVIDGTGFNSKLDVSNLKKLCEVLLGYVNQVADSCEDSIILVTQKIINQRQLPKDIVDQLYQTLCDIGLLLKMVPIQITVPIQAGSAHSTPKSITVHVPAYTLQGGTAGVQLKSVLSSPTFTAALSLPVEMSQTLIQQHIYQAFKISTPTNVISQVPTANRAVANSTTGRVAQVDGPGDTSDEDDIEDEDEDVETQDEERDEEDEDNDEENQNVSPLNSDDDVTEEDPTVFFETENVVVCQYDKISRNRNRWKLLLKDGVMHINGRDYVFQKANGDADW